MDKGERYDDQIHGSDLVWLTGKPEKYGYYTVIVSVRNHWWVRKGYLWNGSSWVTPGHSITTAVIRFLPESWRETR